MSQLIVKGFTNGDSEFRQLQRKLMYQESGAAVEGSQPVLRLENCPAEANMIFGTAKLEISNMDGQNIRRIHFDDGQITCLKGNFPMNISTIRFTRASAPNISMDWDLNNEELAKLMTKSALGSDYDIDPEGPFGKPKGPMQVPELFTDAEWEGIPIKVDLMAMSDGNVPVVGVTVVDQYDLKTNSRIAGYMDIAGYFKAPETYAIGDKSADKDELFVSLESDKLIGYEQRKAQAEAQQEVVDERANVIEAPVGLSQEELAEQQRRSEMQNEIDTLIAAADDARNVDGISGSDIPEAPEAPEMLGEDEAYTDAELEELGLVASPKSEDERRAEQKMRSVRIANAQATQAAQQQHNRDIIAETMTEGERVAGIKSDGDSRSNPTF